MDGSSGVNGFSDSLDELDDAMSRSCDGQEEWALRVVAGLRTALGFAADNPEAARVLTIESAGLGSAEHYLHEEMIRSFAARLEAGAPRPPVVSSGRALVASVVTLVAGRLRGGDEARLPEAAPDLAYLLLVPYVGFHEASAWAYA